MAWRWWTPWESQAVGEPKGVDVGLGGPGRLTAPAREPGQEDLGHTEALLSVLAGGGPQRPGRGGRAHPRELVPQSELAQQPLMQVPVQGG